MQNPGILSPVSGFLAKNQAIRDLALITSFSILNAIGAQISLHLPFTPVPVTMEVFFVILSGLVLGSRLGALSQIEFLALGVSGLPVFSDLVGGPLALMRPTGGYLIGFVAGAFLVGLIREKFSEKKFAGIIAVAAGIAAVYLFGVLHLTWMVFGGNMRQAFIAGALPFIGVDIAKAIFALGSFKLVKRVISEKC